MGSTVQIDVRANVEQGSSAISSFTDVLKDFKSEQTSNARTANFFANELAEIIPGAEGAAGALKKLVGIGLEGFGIGAGIELASLALKTFAEKIEEHRRNMAELRQLHFDTWRGVRDAIRDVTREFEGPLGKVDAVMRTQTDGIKKQIEELKFKLNELTVHASFWQSLAADFGVGQNEIEQTQRKIAALNKEMQKLATSPDAYAARTLEEARQAQIGHDKIVATAMQTADELVRIKEEANNRIREIERTTPDSDPSKAGQIATIKADAEQRANELRRQRAIEHSRAVVAIESETYNTFERLAVESSERMDAIREKYRMRIQSGSDADRARARAQQKEELDAETTRFQRLAELQEAAITRHRAQTVLGEQALAAARMSEAVAAEQSINDLRARLETDGQHERYTKALDEIRKRELDEHAVIAQALVQRQITTAQADAMLSKSSEKASKDRREAWLQDNRLVGESLHQLANEFASSITSMIDGSKSLGQALEDLGKRMLQSVLDGLLRIGAARLADAIADLVLSRTTAASKVTEQAGIAGATAAASTASIPGVGPFLAIGAGEAMAAAVLAAFLPMASARGGYDIPGGIDPVVQLHQKEMVLPADIAEPLRASLAGGGMGGPQIHFHGMVVGTGDFFALPEVQRAMRSARRNGVLR